MTSLPPAVKLLIKINLLTAIAALVTFVFVREQQSTLMSDRSKSADTFLTYRSAVTEHPAEIDKRVEVERARQLEEKLQKVNGELAKKQQKIRELMARSPRSDRTVFSQPTRDSLSHQLLANRGDLSRVNSIESTPPSKGQAQARSQGFSRTPRSPVPEFTRPQPLTPSQTNHPTANASVASQPLSPANLVPIPPSPESDAPQEIRLTLIPDLSPARSETGVPRDGEPSESMRYANDIAVGLMVAGDKGQITYGTNNYRRVQTAIRLLRQGEDIDNAARKATIPVAMLSQLLKWGEEQHQIALNPAVRNSGNSEQPASIRYANDIAVGLIVAGDKGQITYGTNNYRRVQTAIRLLRQGEDIDNAARRAAISATVLHQLIQWGENRPGNLSALNEMESNNSP